MHACLSVLAFLGSVTASSSKKKSQDEKVETFVKTSIFRVHNRFDRVPNVNGAMHNLTVAQVFDSLPGDLQLGFLSDPTGSPTLRYCFALKPIENASGLENSLLKACVEAVNRVKAEATLETSHRQSILDSLRKYGLFGDISEGFHSVLSRFYGRRALALIAPLLGSEEISWLHIFDVASLTSSHEFLDGIQNFSLLSIEVIELAARNYYDFTVNLVAMKPFFC